MRIGKVLEREGKEIVNGNGRRIIELCLESDVALAITKSRHKEIHIYMRVVDGGNERFIIDYFLINKSK